MRPSLRVLQNFAKLYFKKSVPTIKWKRMKNNVSGISDIKKNIIYLNPSMSLTQTGCDTALGYYEPKTQIQKESGEQYFYTLTHEIGHFKIRPSKSLLKARAKLETEYKNDFEELMRATEDYQIRATRLHIKVDQWAVKEFKKRRKEIHAILGIK